MAGNGCSLMLNDSQCPIPTKSGAPCRARPLRSGYCVGHDPALETKRQQARVKGGKGKAGTVRARKLLMTEEPQVILEAH